MEPLLFSPPRLHRAAHGEERKITWLELFYDLVYVAALIQLGNILSEDLSLAGFMRFVIIFAPLWWAWTGMTFYMNRFVVDDIPHRVLIYLQITAIAALGISLEGAFSDLTLQFSLAYVLIRLIQIILYIRTWKHEPATRPLTQRYVTGYLVGIALWTVAAFLPAQYAAVLWLLALAIEIGNAFLPGTRALVSLLPPDVEHMRERYGIFVIIVLGESFIKTVTDASGTHLTPELLAFSLLGIFVVFGLWWLYFDDVELAEIKHRAISPYIWIYAHLPLALGVTAFGVASKKLFHSVEKGHLNPEYAILFCTALILYALATAMLELALVQPDERKKDYLRAAWRLGLALGMAGLLFLGAELSPLVFIALTATLMLVVILADEWPHLRDRL